MAIGFWRMLRLAVFVIFASVPVMAQEQSEGAGPAPGSVIPLTVGVGILVEQIVSVDQKSENFGVVANIRLEWKDPKLAFDSGAYGRHYKILTPDEFASMAASVPTTAPAFVIQNQQNRRWSQQESVVIESSGHVLFFEKSTMTLQAPYFDFRKFPFDTQRFFVEVASVHPETEVAFVPLREHSGLGDLLGEEAWIMENADLYTSRITGLSGLQSSQVALGFTGRRHIQYYALRIFLPMAVLIVVSWMTFFLDEYRRRIEITGANLLAFIVFNFAVSDKLPELGYLTFLDYILQWMFIVTGAIIVLNVGLTRLVKSGKEELAHKIDTYVIKWVYPVGYGAVVVSAVFQFLLR